MCLANGPHIGGNRRDGTKVVEFESVLEKVDVRSM